MKWLKRGYHHAQAIVLEQLDEADREKFETVRKAIEPPGEAKADWLMLSELATRIGYPTSYDHPS